MKLFIFVSALVIGANAAGNLLEELQRLNASIAVNLIKLSGLTDMFTTGGPYTVLAPTDAALGKLPEEQLVAIQQDKAGLAAIVKYHLIQGVIFSTSLKNGDTFRTLDGRTIKVTGTMSGGHMFNGATVVKHDNQASNGVIYLIDTVLKFPEANILAAMESRPELSTFLSAIKGAHLDSLLNTTFYVFTVFAPTNDAFATIPVEQWDAVQQSRFQLLELVDYHIHIGQLHKGSLNHNGTMATRYPGQFITVHIATDGEPVLNHVARLSEPDIETGNGIVHVIDHLLIPTTLSHVIG